MRLHTKTVRDSQKSELLVYDNCKTIKFGIIKKSILFAKNVEINIYKHKIYINIIKFTKLRNICTNNKIEINTTII